MGFGMSMNIQKKIPADAQFFICDVNRAVLDKFVQEAQGQAQISILDTPKDIVENAVRLLRPSIDHFRR